MPPLFSWRSTAFIGLSMTLLWLCYGFTSSIPYVLEVEWIDDEYVMKKGCYPEVWLLLSTAYQLLTWRLPVAIPLSGNWLTGG